MNSENDFLSDDDFIPFCTSGYCPDCGNELDDVEEDICEICNGGEEE